MPLAPVIVALLLVVSPTVSPARVPSPGVVGTDAPTVVDTTSNRPQEAEQEIVQEATSPVGDPEPTRDASAWKAHGDAELSAQRFQSASDAYARSAELALAEGDFVLRSAALGNAAIASLERGDLDAARDAIQLAIEACGHDGSSVTMCKLLNVQGAIHQRRGDARAAAMTYRQALDIADELGDDRRRVLILNNIAVSSMNCGAYDDALEFLARVEDLGRRHDDAEILSAAWTNRGETLHLMGQHADALVPLQQALEVRREQGDPRKVAETLIGFGAALKDLGRYGAALESLQEALDITERLDLGLDRIVILAHQADIYASLGDEGASMAAAEASRDALEGTAALERLGIVQEALSRAHEASGDYVQALAFQRQAFATHRRLEHERTTSELHALQTEMEDREAATAVRWIVATGTGGLLVIGFLALVVTRGRQHADRHQRESDRKLKFMESALQLNAQALHMASEELDELRTRQRNGRGTDSDPSSASDVLHPRPSPPDRGVKPADGGPTRARTP